MDILRTSWVRPGAVQQILPLPVWHSFQGILDFLLQASCIYKKKAIHASIKLAFFGISGFMLRAYCMSQSIELPILGISSECSHGYSKNVLSECMLSWIKAGYPEVLDKRIASIAISNRLGIYDSRCCKWCLQLAWQLILGNAVYELQGVLKWSSRLLSAWVCLDC